MIYKAVEKMSFTHLKQNVKVKGNENGAYSDVSLDIVYMGLAIILNIEYNNKLDYRLVQVDRRMLGIQTHPCPCRHCKGLLDPPSHLLSHKMKTY